MESKTTRQFRRLLSELPAEVQRAARRKYRLFQSDPAHPSLQFKRLEGEDNIYSVRIGLGYRAPGVVREGRVIWHWIGNHGDYDRLV
jgi:mRNA-degrading endonuclease RelE of RelBE toxin-antitoxin system